MEFSNLICGSQKVTIIDVDKPRVSLVEVDCEKYCRRWTIIKEKCDEFQGHLMYLTQSEESLIKKSCSKTWRSAESKLVQPRILAPKGCNPTPDLCGTATVFS